jgi:dihydrofolate synthase/folylpolyglutamate synthase
LTPVPASALRAQAKAPETSADILARFCRARDGQIRLALEPAYLNLLTKLGDPHRKLPPVFHVAGTNGKGSTCAFLRAILEAAGYRVHVYTSPHLVRFHERIRIAGKLIEEPELAEILGACERVAAPDKVSDFEVATAAAFVAFARHPADFTILEVGMGGRLDATNLVEKPLASIIARLSYDHCKYLGNTLTAIAREKAGIMKSGIPCFAASQPDAESIASLRGIAAEKGVPLVLGGTDWRVAPNGKDGFRFTDKTRDLDLPPPALIGTHQLENAGLAIAALSVSSKPIPAEAIARGLQTVEWPARLQRLTEGALADMLPPRCELWLDGGHNDSAGEALARQAEKWRAEDGEKRPFWLVFGMLTTKNPCEFLAPLVPYVERLLTVAIPGEALSYSADELAEAARAARIEKAAAALDVQQALKKLSSSPAQGRILICGSLYLAGHVLRLNGGGKISTQ